jgi:hypothetical protein
MGLRYNPFNCSFDFTRSPGSYLDGEVATFADLPLGTAAAPLNSAWLVRAGSGLWLLTRKPAGIYIRTATGGTDRNADYTYASAFPDVFSDANFTVYDDADSTKNLQFQLSGITTGTTRTLTVPNKSGTIATTDASDLTSGTLADARLSGNVALEDVANTFTQNQTLNGTNNVAPNQTAASGSSLITRDLGDARYALYENVRPENNQTAADAANFFSSSAIVLPLNWIPTRIEIHAELEFTTTPVAAGVSNFRHRLAIRDVEGASMNVTSNTSVLNSSSVTNVTGNRYIIKGEITSFPATWSTRLASHGTIFLILEAAVFNFTGGSLTLVNNQDRRVGYRVYR